MNTSDIKPAANAANWLRINESHGHLSITRVNADGERIQIVSVFPDEIPALFDLLARRSKGAA